MQINILITSPKWLLDEKTFDSCYLIELFKKFRSFLENKIFCDVLKLWKHVKLKRLQKSSFKFQWKVKCLVFTSRAWEVKFIGSLSQKICDIIQKSKTINLDSQFFVPNLRFMSYGCKVHHRTKLRRPRWII